MCLRIVVKLTSKLVKYIDFPAYAYGALQCTLAIYILIKLCHILRHMMPLRTFTNTQDIHSMLR